MSTRTGAASALRRSAPLLGLAATTLLFLILAPGSPLSFLDVRTIAIHTVIMAVAALGTSFVIVSGGIDLSIGSVVAISSVAAAEVMTRAPGDGTATVLWPLLAVIAGIAVGGLCGAYNGLLITTLRLPPFIATLGTLGFFRGMAKWLCDGRPISPSAGPGWLSAWVNPTPVPQWLVLAPGVWLMLALAGAGAAVMKLTVFGRQTIAIGSSEEAARRCGIPIARTRLLVYTLAGLFVGLAGVLQFARLTQGDPTVAIGLELDVIAAVVIGGASLTGGHASIAGAVCGAALMALLRNRCTALGWPNYVQDMVVGHIIIVAVALDRWRARRA